MFLLSVSFVVPLCSGSSLIN